MINSLVLSQYGNHAFFKLVPPKKVENPGLEKPKEEEKQPEKEVVQPQENKAVDLNLNKPARPGLSSVFKKEQPIVKENSVIEEKGPISLGENKVHEEKVEINAEAEEVRRRRLLLEAAEKRATTNE